MNTQAPLPMQNSGFSGLSQRKPRWDDKIPYYDIPKDGQWYKYRFFGPLYMQAAHWLETKSGKRFPLACRNYDCKTQRFSNTGCKIEEEFDPKNSQIKKIKDMQARQSGLIHAIPRALQRLGSTDPAWRPWRPVRVPMTVIMAIKQLTGLNVHNINGQDYQADVADPYYGQDVNIMYDPNGQNPNQKYTVALGGHTPLTAQEMTYLNELYNWENLVELPSVDEVKQALQINGYYQLLNGGPQAQTTNIGDQVLAGVPQPPAYQMTSISPGATQVAPAPQPAGLTAPGYPPAPPVYQQQPQQQPQQYQQPAAPQYQPQPAPHMQPAPAQPYQQPVVPAPAPSYIPPQPAQPMPAQAAPLPQNTPGFSTQSVPEMTAQPVAQALQAPVAALPMSQPVQMAPTPAQAVSNNVVSMGGAERRFSFPGKPNGLSASELQAVVNDFSQTLPRATPLKPWDRDDMSGMQVLACFGAYKGDPSCIRCPQRRYCLTY